MTSRRYFPRRNRLISFPLWGWGQVVIVRDEKIASIKYPLLEGAVHNLLIYFFVTRHTIKEEDWL